MQSKYSMFKRLSFDVEDNSFFDNFILDSDVKDSLRLEQFPQIVEAASLCICLNGESNITIDTKNYHIKKGDMCVVLPNSILQVNKQSADFLGYTSACTSNFLASINVSSGTEIYLYIKDNPCLSLEEKEVEELMKMCNILKEYNERREQLYREEISKHLSAAIIYEVISIYKKQQPITQHPYSRKNKLYYEYMELVAKNHRKQRNIEYYANELCISSRHLSSICKEITEKTAKDCLNEYIIINIQTILATTEMTILQISEEFNFPNASFFTKFFKTQTGITPKEYRNTIRD